MKLKQELKYLYRWLRPKNAKDALTIRHRFAIAYAFIGWNSVMYLFYLLFKGEIQSDTKDQKFSLITPMEKSKSYQIVSLNGLTVTKNITVKKDKKAILQDPQTNTV